MHKCVFSVHRCLRNFTSIISHLSLCPTDSTVTLLRCSNYFYRLCLTGQFSRNCCPRYLEEPCFEKLKVSGARAWWHLQGGVLIAVVRSVRRKMRQCTALLLLGDQ